MCTSVLMYTWYLLVSFAFGAYEFYEFALAFRTVFMYTNMFKAYAYDANIHVVAMYACCKLQWNF